MEIEEIKKLKRKLESDIFHETHNLVEKFRKEAGISPYSISIHLSDIDIIGAETQRTISGVKVSIEL